MYFGEFPHMDLRPRRTRVKAPVTSFTSARKRVADGGSMKFSTQNQSLEGRRQMQTPFAADSHSRPSKVDIRPSIRIATWNVLTLAHTRYPEATVNELLNYRVNLAGLTETVRRQWSAQSGGSIVILMALPCYLTGGSQIHWYSGVQSLTDYYALVWFTNMVICQ